VRRAGLRLLRNSMREPISSWKSDGQSLAAVIRYMLFKRQSCLLRFDAGLIRRAVQPRVFFFGDMPIL
jgi:hypothetical protein